MDLWEKSSQAEKIQKSGKWQCYKIPENSGDLLVTCVLKF